MHFRRCPVGEDVYRSLQKPPLEALTDDERLEYVREAAATTMGTLVAIVHNLVPVGGKRSIKIESNMSDKQRHARLVQYMRIFLGALNVCLGHWPYKFRKVLPPPPPCHWARARWRKP